MTDLFDTLDPKDGFHVVKLEFNNELSIHCQAYMNGELANLLSSNSEDTTVEIISYTNPTNIDHGAATRLHLVLDSIARYLTTGGNWNELELSLHKMRRVACGNLVFPDYHLLDSYVTTEGTYQHIFVKSDNSGKAVLWEEPGYSDSGGLCGGFIDKTTLQELLDQEEDEKEEDPYLAPEETDTIDLQLPNKQKSEAEEGTDTDNRT